MDAKRTCLLGPAFGLALAFGGPLAAQPQPATVPGFDSASIVYRCAGGAKLPVVYLNIRGGDSFATVYVNGRLALMRAGPTGSGANYVPVDAQAGYRWHVKGDVGSLWFRAAEPAAQESMMLQDCRAQRPQ